MKLALAIACAAGCLALVLAPGSSSGQGSQVARGRTLYLESCASCHGMDARGVKGLGPSLLGVGARAADFYLSTGRMPIDQPDDQPLRKEPAFPRSDIDALVAYIGSLGGPPIPRADPSRGSLKEGFQEFTDSCAGCHQIVGQGGMVTGARVPALQHATPTEIAEAVRIGPYLMPKFSIARIDQHKLDSLARYIQYTRAPQDKGGWGIGHIGPIPEGFVAWLLGLAALILAARAIGERTPE
ncbi:MAG TPA: c-type cytochrome [Thermoleophilaceae bacterium]|jgi:ubiquinol-cytochrome c reductase cytochrome c subunit